jgi:hypothetical protein
MTNLIILRGITHPRKAKENYVKAATKKVHGALILVVYILVDDLGFLTHGLCSILLYTKKFYGIMLVMIMVWT